MMKQVNTILRLTMFLLLFSVPVTAQELETVVPDKQFPEEYLQVTHDRAYNFVKEMELSDAKKERVTGIVAQQYRDLSAIQDTRDSQLKLIENKFEDRDTREQLSRVVRIKAGMREEVLHRQFIARLTAEITAEQVNRIKDGMTYNVVPVTYNRYMELLPDLTEKQQTTIRAYLIEAREHAIDAGSSEQRHHIFNEYKGKINNYVSAEGYDLEEAEKRLREQEQNGVD